MVILCGIEELSVGPELNDDGQFQEGGARRVRVSLSAAYHLDVYVCHSDHR
jgi:hypothetical protein